MDDPLLRIERALAGHQALRFLPPLLAAFPEAEAYLVGGAVRDLLLNRPTADYDFVLRRLPREAVETWFSARGQLDLVGRVFGVYKFLPACCQLPTASCHPIDLALPRTETPASGRLGGYRDFDVQSDPSLPIERDLARRDFTVNAMAYDVRQRELIDPFEGRRDLQARLIRAVGTPRERFAEDLSRLLRGMRFACQLDFEIDADTWLAMRQTMPEGNRTRTRADGASEFVLPRETVGRELAKALDAQPLRAAQLFLASGAFACFLPEVARAAQKRPDRFLAPLEARPSLPAALALLLRETTPANAKRALNAAGLSSLPRHSGLRAMAEDVAWIVERLAAAPDASAAETTPGHDFERTYMNERGTWYLEALSALGKTELVDAARARIAAIRERCGISGSRRGDPIPSLATGGDVLALGVAPGPRVRELLDAVRDAQFAGEIRTKEEAVAALRTWTHA